MSAALFALAVIAAAPAEPAGELSFVPVVQQGFAIYLSDTQTAGGLGGAAGLQFVWRDRWLAQADVGTWWMLGNVASTRLAVGVQRRGTWAPAVWVAVNTMWGSRLRFLDQDGTATKAPPWAVGLRASPLRFAGERGLVSLLDVGVGLGTSGKAAGTWLELSLLQVGFRW